MRIFILKGVPDGVMARSLVGVFPCMSLRSVNVLQSRLRSMSLLYRAVNGRNGQRFTAVRGCRAERYLSLRMPVGIYLYDADTRWHYLDFMIEARRNSRVVCCRRLQADFDLSLINQVLSVLHVTLLARGVKSQSSHDYTVLAGS